VRTAVAVVAGPVALQDFNVASHAESRKPVLATCVDAMLVREDCQWWAKFDLVELGPIHCGFQAKGHGVQGWAQWVGHLRHIHKELAVTLLYQQRCDNGCCVGRQSGVGGDGKVAGDEHPGSKVTGRCCCLVKIAHHGPRLPTANHPNDERIDASSK